MNAALTAKAAGDDFWVSEDHAESTAGSITHTSPGTSASPCRIICVDHAGTVPPVSADLRTTATITTTGANSITCGTGYAYVYGISFSCGTGSSAANFTVGSSSACWWKFDSCALKLITTSATSLMIWGINTTANISKLEFNNTPITFGAVGQQISIRDTRVHWTNTASAIVTTVPTTLFTSSNTTGAIRLQAVDLSAAGSGKNLINLAATVPTRYVFQNCKLGSTVTIGTGTHAGQGGVEILMVNCDSTDTNYRYHLQNYQGTITNEITIVRTGGATDGVTPVSRKMVSSANTKFYSPLESDPIYFWNNGTSSITVTVPVITDNVTLTNGEAWIQVEYQGTSGFPQSVTDTSSRAADVLATTANQPTDSTSTWTTTGLTTPIKQSLTATITPTGKGVVKVKVMLAKVSTTMYFDPVVLSGSQRQWMSGESGYINEVNNPIGRITGARSIGTY